MRLVWGTVSALIEDGEDVQRLAVALDDGTAGQAVNYTRLAGTCAVADRLLLNTTAVDLDLGTGGLHFVVARAGLGEGVQLDDPSGGHIMKMRYTPLQRDVLAVESPESPHHATMSVAENIAGMPVVCCGLHSQAPLVAAAIKDTNPTLRVAYCMTDHAALPLAFSDIVRASVSAGLFDATVTCGQAFGGQYEAVNLHSGLLAAHSVVLADVAIVAVGPGIVGTATPFGHGGIAQGEALNAVAALGGTPIACLRVSFADTRARHRVVSHHTLAALARIALAPCLVAVPSLAEEYAQQLEAALANAGVWSRHERAEAVAGSVAPPDMRGVAVSTMGRAFADDPAFFAAAYAAGEIAARTSRGRVSDKAR